MSVLAIARFRAALCPEPLAWDWPPKSEARIYNWRFRKIERPVIPR